MCKGSNFTTSSPTLVPICVFDSSHLSGYEWYLIVDLIFISLMTNDLEHLFMCSVSSSEKTFGSYMYDKGFVSRTYSKILHLNNRKINKPM